MQSPCQSSQFIVLKKHDKPNPALVRDVEERRTFAIISHPDAGKTTLTEKLLLFGGAIQMAGAVKGRKASRHATSDWMEVEKQRGISVTNSVMQFHYRDHVINLLDTPGHEDFSEDTYRVLTAVDAAVMVIDAAKGVRLRRSNCLKSVVCARRRSSRSSINSIVKSEIPSICSAKSKRVETSVRTDYVADWHGQNLSRRIFIVEESSRAIHRWRRSPHGRSRID